MFVVKQENDYTCVLACIESFLRDAGVEVNQAEMIAAHPTICHEGQDIEGAMAVTLDNFREIGTGYGFDVVVPTGCPPIRGPGRSRILPSSLRQSDT